MDCPKDRRYAVILKIDEAEEDHDTILTEDDLVEAMNRFDEHTEDLAVIGTFVELVDTVTGIIIDAKEVTS